MRSAKGRLLERLQHLQGVLVSGKDAQRLAELHYCASFVPLCDEDGTKGIVRLRSSTSSVELELNGSAETSLGPLKVALVKNPIMPYETRDFRGQISRAIIPLYPPSV